MIGTAIYELIKIGGITIACSFATKAMGNKLMSRLVAGTGACYAGVEIINIAVGVNEKVTAFKEKFQVKTVKDGVTESVKKDLVEIVTGLVDGVMKYIESKTIN